MKFNKKFLIIFSILMAIFAIALPVSAQNATVYTIGPWNGGTNNVAAASTNSTGYTIACSDFNRVTLQLTLASTAANNSNATFRVYRSIDSTTYETSAQPSMIIPVTCNGTTAVTVVTNLDTLGAGVLKIVGPENPHASAALTNISVKARFISPKYKL